MYTDNEEAAYFAGRVERSTALAAAATGTCARLAHQALAELYGQRLVGLVRPAAASLPATVSASPTRARS